MITSIGARQWPGRPRRRATWTLHPGPSDVRRRAQAVVLNLIEFPYLFTLRTPRNRSHRRTDSNLEEPSPGERLRRGLDSHRVGRVMQQPANTRLVFGGAVATHCGMAPVCPASLLNRAKEQPR